MRRNRKTRCSFFLLSVLPNRNIDVSIVQVQIAMFLSKALSITSAVGLHQRLFVALCTAWLSSSAPQASCFATLATTYSPSFLHPSSHSRILLRGGTTTTSHSSSTSTTSEEAATATTTETSTMDASAKLHALRSRMQELGVDIYLVPTDDPHLCGTLLLSSSY